AAAALGLPGSAAAAGLPVAAGAADAAAAALVVWTIGGRPMAPLRRRLLDFQSSRPGLARFRQRGLARLRRGGSDR
ncbi:MAG TPA: hypothetical protein VEP73_01440, partial [Actinomycetota bacterium]|nr:hypothetical protein [Actinomycetota bacterium]